MSDFDRKYKEAKRNVKRKKGFYMHLSVFLIVGTFLAFINLFTDPSEIWFPIPIAAWSIGLGIQYVKVFGIPGKQKILSKDWEERQMEKELIDLGAIEDEPTLDLNENGIKEKQKENRNWNDDGLV